MTKTYYDLLGVAPDASTEEIERAYRERLKEIHPDVSDDDDAGDRTRRLIEARDVLTDDRERRRYDRLGHEQYVGREDARGPQTGRASPTGSESATDRGTTTGADGSTSGGRAQDRAGRRRRGADPDPGRANGSATGSDGIGGGSGPTSESPGPETEAGGGSGGRASANAGDGSTRDNRRREHVGTPSWSGHREAEPGASRAWNPDSPYAVHRSEDGMHGSRLFPAGPSLVLLVATFVLYPILVASTLVPPFPLVVRLVVGGCALGVVAYLQSIPEVGMVVFGAWLVLGPAALVALGVPLLSTAGWVVAVATGVPFGLSVLIWHELR